MEYIGNKTILKNDKIAFLCSRKYPAHIVLKAYDWAIEQRDKGNCVISGFHSQIEQDVLHYLLKGKQPVILALARRLKKRETDKAILKALKDERLLIVTPFDKSVIRVTRETALKKNELIAELADEICIAHATKGGNIDDIYLKFSNKKIFRKL